ncbi:MAG: ATP-binding protein [Coriobacteriales bacterium]|jgi:AAA+ ATPase superfamily predicted ATPase|nr:ATP-binding protein [Coriobacteriales bacterium]
MRFYDRKTELRTLAAIEKSSRRSSQFTLLTGRRRVGKTALLQEAFKGRHCLYLFVARKSETLLCESFQQAAQQSLGLPVFGRIVRFRDLFEQLLIHAKDTHLTLMIDEFQDFARVNPALFSEMQELWDRYKDTAKINLVVCGSIYSLLVRIFENQKEPLFGRLTNRMELAPFSTATIKEVLSDHNADYTPEDLLSLYLLSGGLPKFLALLMDADATSHSQMLRYATSQGSPFLTEGKDILVSEFGKDYGTYFSILQLIASNKTSASEMSSIIGRSAGPYLENLSQEYSLVRRLRPIFSKPQSRNNRWRISDHYLNFWFRFIYANQALVELQRFDLLHELLQRDYPAYSGLVLEDYFRTKVMEKGRFTEVGSYWDRKGENELDLIALSSLDKKALVAEVKRNASRIDLAILKAKAQTLQSELARLKVEYRGLSMEDM